MIYFAQNKTVTKFILLLSLLFYSFACLSQIKIASTDKFSIEENSKALSFFSIEQSDTFLVKNIGDVIMVSSKGEEKPVRKNVKGILLRDVLSKITLEASRTKDLNQYFFLLEATDGYKVVLSRNEVFNTDNLYIITESNGNNIKQSFDRIEILALSAVNKGHIYIKGLKRLTIHKPG